jgi:hypothetical protein
VLKHRLGQGWNKTERLIAASFDPQRRENCFFGCARPSNPAQTLQARHNSLISLDFFMPVF